jgi:hypothetical protein
VTIVDQDKALSELERRGWVSGPGGLFNMVNPGVTIVPPSPPSILGTQVGGDHYTKQAIQPIEYIWANNIGFSEGNVIKYVTRWKDKGGIKDLEKAQHHIALLIEHAKKVGMK